MYKRNLDAPSDTKIFSQKKGKQLQPSTSSLGEGRKGLVSLLAAGSIEIVPLRRDREAICSRPPESRDFLLNWPPKKNKPVTFARNVPEASRKIFNEVYQSAIEEYPFLEMLDLQSISVQLDEDCHGLHYHNKKIGIWLQRKTLNKEEVKCVVIHELMHAVDNMVDGLGGFGNREFPPVCRSALEYEAIRTKETNPSCYGESAQEEGFAESATIAIAGKAAYFAHWGEDTPIPSHWEEEGPKIREIIKFLGDNYKSLKIRE